MLHTRGLFAHFTGFIRKSSGKERATMCGCAIEWLESRTMLSAGTLVGASQSIGFTVGPMAADPGRDVVYIADNSDQKIIVVNTDTGSTSGVFAVGANVTGLAVSPDDSRLYVAESTADQIEVFSALGHQVLNILHVGVPVNGLAALANNRVASGTSSGIQIFDGGSGQSLYILNGDYEGEIKSSVDGTILYSRQRGISGGSSDVRQWDVSGTGAPNAMASIPGPSANSEDFTVDPTLGRAYMSDGGVYGVTEVNILTGVQTFWPHLLGPYGSGVAELPGSPFVYSLSIQDVEQFNQNGVVLNTYSFPGWDDSASLVITPNGHLMWASDGNLSIIGVSNLSVTTTELPYLAFQVQPKSGVAGKAPGTVVVDIVNGDGQILTGDNSKVTLTVNGPGGAVKVQVTAKHGVATFSKDFILTKAANYSITATDGADFSAASSSFTVAPGAATKLVFSAQPVDSKAGAKMKPVSVLAEDAYGNVATTTHTAVTLSVAAGPGPVAGAVTETLLNGAAVFNDLALQKVGRYTLVAKGKNLSVVKSKSFSVARR